VTLTEPRNAGGLALLSFDSLDQVHHAISSRHGGVSPDPYRSLNMGYATDDRLENVVENRSRLARAVGAPADAIVSGRLSHASEVAVFAGSRGSRPDVPFQPRRGAARVERGFEADAVVSDVPGLYFLLTFADCVPLVFFDPERHVVGAAHAGWRGTSLAIAVAVVRTMRDVFGSRPESMRVAIGPSIGPCCYTVTQDVLETFASRGVEPVVTRNHAVRLDLWKTNQRQLRDAGIPAASIENPRICTSCNVDSYFSHRAENGMTGRFALCACLAPA